MPANFHPRIFRLVSSGLAALMFGGATFTARGQDLPLDAGKSSVTFVGEAFLHNFRGEAKNLSGQASLDPARSRRCRRRRSDSRPRRSPPFTKGAI
jgi:hypothetical protein